MEESLNHQLSCNRRSFKYVQQSAYNYVEYNSINTQHFTHNQVIFTHNQVILQTVQLHSSHHFSSSHPVSVTKKKKQ